MGRPQIFGLDDLVAAGLEVAAGYGWSAVSVRSVADALDVSPMALYRLVSDATELRRIIADGAAVSLEPVAQAGDLLEALNSWARRAYRDLGRYAGLAAFVITQWTELPHWLDIVESLLERAEAGGLRGSAAVSAVNAVYAYVLVRCQLRDTAAIAPRRQLAPVRSEKHRYPLIRANLQEFTMARTDEHFAIGLEVLSAGLRTQLAR